MLLRSLCFKIRLKAVFTILCLCLFFSNSHANKLATPYAGQQLWIEKAILKGVEHLYEDQFDEAERLFNQMITRFPSEPVGYFYLSMVSWSRLTFGFWHSQIVQEYVERIDRTIAVANRKIKMKENDSYDFFYLGGALGFKARFELMKRKWISAFFPARRAVINLKKCLALDPHNRDVFLGLGIFDYYTARLSGTLKILSYLLIHQGNRIEGLSRLKIASQEAKYSSSEAKSVLVHIYMFLEEDYLQALPITKELSEKYKHNCRYKVLEGVCLIRLGMPIQFKNTVKYLQNRGLKIADTRKANRWRRRALYLQSINDLYKQRTSEARCKLKKILSFPDPTRDPLMIAWPMLKIGMSYDLDGMREEATKRYRAVLGLENGSGAQFLALKLLDEAPLKNDPFLGY